MGYSCTAKASEVETAIVRLLQAAGEKSSNTLPGGGFFERGRENPDGAITGQVWRPLTHAEKIKWVHLNEIGSRVTRAGGYKITAEGKIERFPGLPKHIKKQAEKEGLEAYEAKFEPASFLVQKKTLLRKLEANQTVRWQEVEAVATAYQKEHKIMFLALPEMDEEAIKKWLDELEAV